MSSYSAPPSPRSGRGRENISQTVLEASIEHLKHQIVVLHLELERNRQGRLRDVTKAETRAKASQFRAQI